MHKVQLRDAKARLSALVEAGQLERWPALVCAL